MDTIESIIKVSDGVFDMCRGVGAFVMTTEFQLRILSRCGRQVKSLRLFEFNHNTRDYTQLLGYCPSLQHISLGYEPMAYNTTIKNMVNVFGKHLYGLSACIRQDEYNLCGQLKQLVNLYVTEIEYPDMLLECVAKNCKRLQFLTLRNTYNSPNKGADPAIFVTQLPRLISLKLDYSAQYNTFTTLDIIVACKHLRELMLVQYSADQLDDELLVVLAINIRKNECKLKRLYIFPDNPDNVAHTQIGCIKLINSIVDLRLPIVANHWKPVSCDSINKIRNKVVTYRLYGGSDNEYIKLLCNIVEFGENTIGFANRWNIVVRCINMIMEKVDAYVEREYGTRIYWDNMLRYHFADKEFADKTTCDNFSWALKMLVYQAEFKSLNAHNFVEKCWSITKIIAQIESSGPVQDYLKQCIITLKNEVS